jgi:uncharacterized protein DUF4136
MQPLLASNGGNANYKERRVVKTKVVRCTALLCLLSAIAFAQTVYVDYNHGIDFSKFKTYAWGQGPNPNAIQDSILLQNAQQDVNSQLGMKGLQMLQESQNPDLIVVMSSGLKQQTSYNAWGTGGWRWGGGMASITPETSDVGTLVVDIYDANGKQMIWRGISQDTMSTKGSKNEKEMNKAIDKMFKQYP